MQGHAAHPRATRHGNLRGVSTVPAHDVKEIGEAMARDLIGGVIRLYQLLISPLLPPSCRFYPSCSMYAREAITRHGVWKGLRLTGWRLLRCQPFHPGGWDPVP